MTTIPTIRVTGIPGNSCEGFVAYIKDNSSGFSLAPSVSSINNKWIATITYQTSIPEAFRSCFDCAEDEEKCIDIPLPTMNLNLYFDRNFHGITPLNYVESPAVDLIAVTGLSAHAFGSWKARGGQAMWLRDYLPDDLKGMNTQIMIYGYDSKLSKSVSHASLHDYAIQFLESIKTTRHTDEEKRRPLILLGHSLGGLVIKQALKEAAHGSNDDRMVLKSCYALLFFGTPSHGMNIEALRLMVKGQSNEQFLNDLGVESQLLPELEREFCRHFDSKILSFYETKGTPVVQFLDGRWQRSGPEVLIVPRSSALHTTQRQDHIALDNDHSNMVKFSHPDNQYYQIVRDKIREVVHDAPTVIKGRFAGDENIVDKGSIYNAYAFDIPVKLDHSRNPNFTGREEDLTQLHQKLSQARTMVIHGSGGMGKSQLVREYIYRHEDAYRSAFWINTTNLETIRSSFLMIGKRLVYSYTSKAVSTPNYTSIAHDLGMTGLIDGNGGFVTAGDVTDRVVEAVIRWFTKPGNDRWLLVFDNADDLSFSFSEYFPPTQSGSIIITSRRRECVRIIPDCAELELGVMNMEESINLLAKSSRRQIKEASEDYQEAVKIASRFANLPLAIDQAGAYIHRLNRPLRSYLPIFENNLKDVLNKKPSSASWQYRDETAFTTWEVSFRAVEEENQLYAQILLICSFLSPEGLTEDLLCRGLKGVEDMETIHDYDFFVADAVATLIDFSLAIRRGLIGSFSIHPLVHYWARERLSQSDRLRLSLKAFHLVGAAIDIGDRIRILNDWDFELGVEPHIASCIFWIKSLHIKGTNLGADLNSSASNAFASVYYEHGKYIDAVEWYERALAGREKALGNEHPSTLSTVHGIASVFSYQGKYDDALEWYQRALAGKEKALGNEHPSTLSTVHNMAVVFSNQGKYASDDALEWYQRALAGREKALGNEHPSTLSTVHAMASVFSDQGKYDDALEWYQRALAGREKALGKDHWDTKSTITALKRVKKLMHG